MKVYMLTKIWPWELKNYTRGLNTMGLVDTSVEFDVETSIGTNNTNSFVFDAMEGMLK